MLKVIIEVNVSDERENQIVKDAGMGYKNLIKYIEQKTVDMFRSDRLTAQVQEVKVIPVIDRD